VGTQPFLPFDEGAERAPAPVEIPRRPDPAQRATPVPDRPARPGSRSRLIDELARVCAAHPLAEKLLISPTLLVGHQIVERLARTGGVALHLRVETPRTVAHGAVGSELAREGSKLLSRAQALALVEQACVENLADDDYFGALRHRAGFHRAVQSVFDELRAAGLGPGSLPVRAFADLRKPREIRRILEAYESALVSGKWVDRAEVLRRAAAGGRAAPNETLFLVPDSLDLSIVERRLLERLAGNRVIPLGSDAPSEWAERAASARIFRASGEENEIRAVLREILSSGVPLDEVEVLHTDAATYPALAFELAAEHGVPATFSGGVAVSFTRPGQAALAFLRWIGRSFEADVLREALANGLLAFPSAMSGRVRPAAAARELRRAAIGWGRERHLPAIDRLAAEVAFPRPLRADDDEDSAARKARRDRRLAAIGAARTFVSRALSLLPEGDRADLPAASRAARLFIAEFARVRDALDGAASTAISKLFAEFESLPGPPAPLAEVAGRLEDAVLSLHVSPDRPRPGRLHFADFRNGGFSGRPRTFVLGLDEKRHPGGGREDPVLSDDERRQINELSSSTLALAPDRSRESSAAMHACVARLRGEIAFGYSGWNLRDLANPGEVFPSPFLLEAFRLKAEEKTADYARLAQATGEGEGFVPPAGRALDETEWWLSNIGDVRGSETARTVARLHPWLADGLAAQEARLSPEPTAWDGVFTSPAPELDPRLNGQPMSASRIQALAECPFGYFLSQVLRLASPDEAEEKKSEWLDAKTAGSSIHRIFRIFLERLTKEGRRPSHPADLAELLSVAGEELDRMRKRIPPRSELAFSRTKEDVRFACRTFLISESARTTDVEPVAFEVAFGIADDERPSENPDPVEIPLGDGRILKLRGMIDRVDRDARGNFHVWDYKTGNAAFTHEEHGIAAGRQIQPALYALAWESLLARRGEPGRVVESGYFFPGRRGLGERFAIAYSPEETRETLNVLFDLLASGAFIHSPDEDSDCFTCRELTAFCGDRKEAGQQSLSKLTAAKSAALTAWRKLRDL